MVSDQYVAGFFDGDGWVTVQVKEGHRREDRKSKTPFFVAIVGFANKNKEVLERIQERFGGSIYTRKNGHHILNIGSDGRKIILEKMLPYLIVKRERAELMIQLLAEFRPRGERNRYNPLNKEEIETRMRLAKKIALLNSRTGHRRNKLTR